MKSSIIKTKTKTNRIVMFVFLLLNIFTWENALSKSKTVLECIGKNVNLVTKYSYRTIDIDSAQKTDSMPKYTVAQYSLKATDSDLILYFYKLAKVRNYWLTANPQLLFDEVTFDEDEDLTPVFPNSFFKLIRKGSTVTLIIIYPYSTEIESILSKLIVSERDLSHVSAFPVIKNLNIQSDTIVLPLMDYQIQ